MQPTSLQIKRSNLRAKIVLTDKRRQAPLAAPRALYVQLGRLARQHVIIVWQVSFEQEEVEMVRLVPRALQECTRRWKVKEVVSPAFLENFKIRRGKARARTARPVSTPSQQHRHGANLVLQDSCQRKAQPRVKHVPPGNLV